MLGLGVLVIAIVVLRYLREVANTKMSMNMVYYIREAVYDKLQRVGFGFHDAVSSGQLINRALSDLQNVRAFVQTAVLSSLEIVLVVGGYIILSADDLAAGRAAVAGAAADLDVLHPALQQDGAAGGQGGDGSGGPERLDHHRKHRRRARGQGVRHRAAGDRQVRRATATHFCNAHADAHPAVRRLHAGHPPDRDGVILSLFLAAGS